MIKIEFPSNRTDIALAIGRALLEIGGAQQEAPLPVEQTPEPDAEAEAPAPAPKKHAGSLFADPTPEIEPEPEPEATGEAPAVDLNGVPRNAELCANAAKPFYESGKTAGQWKKARNVDQGDYDAWYSAALAQLADAEPTPEPEEPAFDAGSQWGAPQTAPAPATTIPQNGGQLFHWIAENQTAGNINQSDVDAAYQQTATNPGMLFTGDAASQAKACEALHAVLSQRGAK